MHMDMQCDKRRGMNEARRLRGGASCRRGAALSSAAQSRRTESERAASAEVVFGVSVRDEIVPFRPVLIVCMHAKVGGPV